MRPCGNPMFIVTIVLLRSDHDGENKKQIVLVNKEHISYRVFNRDLKRACHTLL